MKQSIFEIGFIGGAINSAVGTVHKIATQMDGKFKLVAGCFSKDAQINIITGTQWRIDKKRIYKHWEELLEQEKDKLDAVVILTPTPDHVYMIQKALELGFNVISEKSLTKSLDEALQIKKQIDKHKNFLTITYNYTGYPAIRELKHLIKSGHLGKINQVMIEMPQEGFIKIGQDNKPMIVQDWRLKDYEIPTISLDLGVHVYNLLSFLLEEDALEVYALESSYGHFKHIIDDIHAIAQFTNNIVCNLWYSKSAIGYRNGLRIRLFGKLGSAEWLQMNPEELIICNNEGYKQIISRGHNASFVLNQPRYNRFKAGHPAGFIEAFANLYEDIHEALYNYKNNSENFFLTPYTFGIEDAIKGLIFLDAMHKSYLSRKAIQCKML